MPRPRFAKLEPEKRSNILEIAAEEFAENGFEGASYNRIIERAGLSKGAMYYYFDDKTDLYATVLEDAFGRMMAAMAEAPVAEGGDFWGRYEQMWKQGIAFTLAHPVVATLVRGLMGGTERQRAGAALEKIYGEIRSFTQALLEQGQAEGVVRQDLPMSLLLSVIFAMGEAVDQWWLERVDELAEQDLDYWARELIGLFRRVAEPKGAES